MTWACEATSGGSPTSALYASALAICMHQFSSDGRPRACAPIAFHMNLHPAHVHGSDTAGLQHHLRVSVRMKAHRCVRYFQTDGWRRAGCG